jgi:hypothetical protein
MVVMWAKVLAEQGPPWWFVEGGDRFSPSRAVCTAFMLLRPIALWKRVELGHRVRLQRALLIVGVLLAAVLVGRVAMREVVLRVPWLYAVEIATTNPMTTRARRIAPLDYEPFFLFAIMCYGVVLPWTMLLLSIVISESLKKAKVRLKHLVRVAIYNTAVMPLLVLIFSGLGIGATVIGERVWNGVWPMSADPVAIALEGPWVFIHPLLTLVWWWAAYRFYMHLRRAFIGAVLMMVCSLLLMQILIFAVAFASISIRGSWI